MILTRPEQPHHSWPSLSHRQPFSEPSVGLVCIRCFCASPEISFILAALALFYLAPIQVSQTVLCAGPLTQCVSPGSSETSWLQPALRTAPAGTGTGMCGSADTGRNPNHPCLEDHQWPPLSLYSSTGGANFLTRPEAGCLLSLTA